MLSEIDLQALWKDLDVFESEVDKESSKLNEISKTIADLRTSLEAEHLSFHNSTDFDFLPESENIKFNIGGQEFEAPVSVLTKDPSSILAICCRKDCPFEKDQDGSYYFDRDWWLFRLILSFLRSKVLPSDGEVLKELYKEAAFYRLEDLKAAIDSIPLHRVSKLAGPVHLRQ